MIADYYFIRKKHLEVNELYRSNGLYSYKNGFNRVAVVALLLGILPNVPGFLVTIKMLPADALPQWINHLYNYAWFVGFLVSGFIYWIASSRPEVKM
jgi:NCS1 family nucleobase:cation symporter-1